MLLPHFRAVTVNFEIGRVFEKLNVRILVKVVPKLPRGGFAFPRLGYSEAAIDCGAEGREERTQARVADFLSGRPLSSAMKKSSWIYFVRDNAKRIALGEVPLSRGKHQNARLTEGPFVMTCFRLISKIMQDRRLKGHRFDLRAIRVESLHFYCMWLKARRTEYFVPITPLGKKLKTARWISRAELVDALRVEGQRVRDAHEKLVIADSASE